jgi:hypothetical protein
VKPPSQIDGADVVLWAWSEPEPFFAMRSSDGAPATPIHGLAICRYAEGGAVCRFSCNNLWETESCRLGRKVDAIDDDSYRQRQVALILRPKQGALIKGSGGLRKIRWSVPGQGKRGGIRVILLARW